MRPFLLLSSLLLLVSPAFAASAADWSTRQIYQLVTDRFATSNDSSAPCDTSKRTYCGGSWQGITNHLDYIQDMGFDAIWISPVVKNVDNTTYGDGYHGYWSEDINSLTPNFGTADELKALSTALHSRGMYLMVDIVVNHFAGVPTNTTASASNQFTFDYSLFTPFNTEADFHAQCFINDYTNQTDVEQCWLGDVTLPLPDLDTEDDDVVSALKTWIENLVKTYDVDGLRIDTVKHIRHDFWSDFGQSAGVWTLGEVLTNNATYSAEYIGAVDAVLDYPSWYNLVTAFGSPSGNLSALVENPAPPVLAAASSSVPVTGVFLENHDQPRFASITSDVALTKNAMAWVFVGDGVPIMYYGQEQGYEGGADPENREALWLSGYETNKPLVSHASKLTSVRKLAIAGNSSFISTPASWIAQSDPSAIALSKPPLLSLFTNAGSNATSQPTWTVPAGLYAANTTLVDVVSCTRLTVGAAGANFSVGATQGLPRVLIPASMLSKSGGACPALATGTSGAARGSSVGAVAAVMVLAVVALV